MTITNTVEINQFHNITGADDENGFLPFDIEDLEETIQDTFDMNEEGEITINHEERYFEYYNEESGLKVTGNF